MFLKSAPQFAFITFMLFFFFILFSKVSAIKNDYINYLIQRQKIIKEEESMSFGANVILNDEERNANNILMKYKQNELKAALNDPKRFLPSHNFQRVSKAIAQSEVFKIIRRMPKGGVLHAHISAITSRDFILNNITRRSHLYVCRTQGSLKLKFLDEARLKDYEDCDWELLEEARKRDKSLDEEIAEAMTMYANDSSYDGAEDSDLAWTKFLNIFDFVKSLITYRPVYEDFLYHIFEELYEDNVQFIEIRTSFSKLYELNGYQYKHAQVVKIYKNVVDRFVKNHPDFFGVKWIYSPQRNVSRSTFIDYISKFRALKSEYPNIIVGFDLVGREDKGRPLKDYAANLLILGKETRFYFHAGETNWYGQEADENILDAILLNTKRIGHGYALIKHPKLMELVKKNNIAIEISPISNQVLKLVKDLRNHPASVLFAGDYPVVISNDDPSFWGARALSYDFYEAFVGIMSRSADLRALKQLAVNSIVHSSLNDSEKIDLMNIWNRRWRDFISNVINDV